MKLTDLRVCGLKNPIGISGRDLTFSWIIESEEKNLIQISYTVRVFDEEQLIWDSGKTESDNSAYVLYTGSNLSGSHIYHWNVEVTVSNGETANGTGTFELSLSPKNRKAEWITSDQSPVFKEKNNGGFGNKPRFRSTENLVPPTYFRRDFTCNESPVKARLYATAHGIYTAYLNGKRVSDALFAPEYTSYYKHLMIQTYDVTALLKSGENTLGVIVADGWWCGTILGGQNCTYGDRHAIWAQLELTYADGSTATICSDSRFRTSTGPYLYADYFIGEYYDARKEITGWNEPGYNDKLWNTALPDTQTLCEMTAQDNPPVRIIRSFAPLELFHTPNGELVLDAGEDIAGFVSFQVTAPAGTAITLQHAEVLDKDGNYFHNLCYVNNHQLVTYICKGEKDSNGNLISESFTPNFSQQGFRYVKITGDCQFKKEDFTIHEISSDNEKTGSFRCSGERITRLQENIYRAQTGNFISIPTDCPQRERAGWTGDTEVFSSTACFNQDTRLFYEKWMTDLRCDQNINGAVPDKVPCDPHKFPNMLGQEGLTGWADAVVIVPYNVYKAYGNTKILKDNYSAMKNWLYYVETHAEKIPLTMKLRKKYRKNPSAKKLAKMVWNTGFQYGDWLIPSLTTGNVLSIFKGAYATRSIFATAYYAYSSRLVSEIAGILGNQEEMEFYREKYEMIRKAFSLWFLNEDGYITPEFQGAYVVALAFGLLEPESADKNAKRLVQMIRQNGNRLDTGFLSVPYLLNALSDNGYVNVAYDVLFQEKRPSWLYELNNGATTFWESWGAIDEKGTRQRCSYNHYAFGSVGHWFYTGIAGLNPTEAGYKSFLIKPLPEARITSAELSLKTVYGMIKEKWIAENGTFYLAVEVPVNTRCTVVLPDGNSHEIGSGEYSFTCKY